MESLQTERDALAARCAEAEQQVAALQAQLAAANARIADLEETSPGHPISIFEGADSGATSLSKDGSDPRVLSMVLAATSVVCGMVAVLALVNGNLTTTLGYAMVAATVILAWAAMRTRVMGTKISISNGVVLIEKGETFYRFDVKQESTLVDMVGEPGDSSWQVQFHRRGMDDFVVDADMVDAEEFVRQLRAHRPNL